VETTFGSSPAAKIKFSYRMLDRATGDVVATGSSVQVFVDVKTFQLQLTIPPFFNAWLNQWEQIR
ncbi:MAG TPA: hypothetical protein VKZ68_03345, partial [Ohtaekwangia sp.]|nr:hypothetical protein [Ohtaekwangia sp.]